jgi:hypothetical protein
MKVREVFPGSTTAGASAEFVELQMYASGQTFVSGHKVNLYAANGTLKAQPPFTDDVTNGQNQRTVLMATTAAASAFGVTPDVTIADANNLDPTGGAVCYPDGFPPDCVSWGNFNNTSGTPLPSATGTPEAAIVDGDSITRTIAPHCPTLLEATDDTNQSATDFFQGAPSPRPNSVTPTEHACPVPNTTITAGPSGTTHDRTPTFRFHSSLANSTFRCKLDSRLYAKCSSPKTYATLSFGGHTFRVKAVKNGIQDPTPARRSFTIVH